MIKTKRILAFFCAVIMILTPVSAAFVDGGTHFSLEEYSQIGENLWVSAARTLTAEGAARQSFTLDYQAGGTITPMVAYGSKVYGKSDINYVTSYLESLGYSVVAAINGDYFNASGVPTGMLIREGRLCVSDGGWNAVGFFADGTAIAGAPRLKMTYTLDSTGKNFDIYAFNKVRTGAGVYLYSDDFSENTRTTLAGTEVVLECENGDYLRLGQPLRLKVVGINTAAPTAIGANRFVLSLSAANTAGLTLDHLKVGETITVTAQTADARWNDVIYSCGGGDMIAAKGKITSSAVGGREPRTILGVMPDGSFSVLVCDGRQKGLSDGLTLKEGAEIMLAKGCTDVINLDGGGSSAISFADAGGSGPYVHSSPSDGAPRPCANYIVFVNEGNPAMGATRAAVYPRSTAVLAGASLDMTALSYNDHYFAKGRLQNALYISSGDGEMAGDTYFAPDYGTSAFVDVYAPGITSYGAQIDVIDAPKTFNIGVNGTAVSSLAVGADTQTLLTMVLTDGLRKIQSQASQFAFSCSGPIGSIDESGLFRSSGVLGATGTITASWNNYSVTIPVTVGRKPLVVDGFESGAAYTAETPLESAIAAEAKQNIEPKDSKYGRASLKLSYSNALAGERVAFLAPAPYKIESGTQNISFFAKGTGQFYIDFSTTSGETVSLPFELSGEFKYYHFALPANALAITGFSAYGIDAASAGVIIDQLMFHFGRPDIDVTPPHIGDIYFDGISIIAEVYDDNPMPLTKDMISLTLDGVALPFNYSGGVLTAQVSINDELLHKITIKAVDFFQNTSSLYKAFGKAGGGVFSDINGHWAAKYIEYLTAYGVFDSGDSFNPDGNVTNEMAATILSRFLKTDTSKYDNLPMPFADGDAISPYAAPHVKAMFYEGVMIGSKNAAGQDICSPQKETTRAQVFTILGRTIERGYAYSTAPFSDYSSVPNWAKDHVDLLYSMGVVKGYGQSLEVRAQNTITRAEMCSLLFAIKD